MIDMTNAEKLTCALRELAMRKRVYPGLVQRGSMTEVQAQHELAAMEAIVDDYRKICGGKRLI